MKRISKLAKPEGGTYVKDLVLIKVPKDLQFSTIRALLNDLIQARCVNIALADDSVKEGSPVSLPISIAHGCHSLHFVTGGVFYSEHDQPWNGDRLWLRLRSDPGGSIRVEGIQCAKTNPTEMEFPMEVKGTPRQPSAKDFPWGGKQPAHGRWDPKTLRDFLKEEEVVALSPVCILEVRGGDRMGDVLQCLSSLQSIAAPRVLANLLLEVR